MDVVENSFGMDFKWFLFVGHLKKIILKFDLLWA